MAEAVESAGPEAEAPRRRGGRPKGARDKNPRKRRNDGIVGQVIDAGATKPAAIAPRPAPIPPPAQLPLAPAESEAPVDLAGGFEDVRRKLKAEADLKVAQAERAERENAIAAGLFVPAGDVSSMLAKRAAVFQRTLLTLPSRLSDEFALENDPRRIRIRLQSELEAVIRGYSGQAADTAPAPSTVDDGATT